MTIDPASAIEGAKARYQTLKDLTKQVLVEGVDYGTIPGTEKPCLYKAGAEKLCATFGLDPRFEILEKIENFDDEKGLFHYVILCRLIHVASGAEIATGIGSCNSKENRYRWRWVSEDDIPNYLDKKTLKKRDSSITEPQFAVEKAETTGQYGKPAEYWQQFKDAIVNHTAYAGSRSTKKGTEMATWIIPSVSYRIPNDEIFTLANTIMKMACKRSLVATTLIGTSASEWFTQDMEDIADFGADFVQGKATPAVATPAPDKIIVDDGGKTATELAKLSPEAEAAAKVKAEAEAKEKALKAEQEAKEKAIAAERDAIMAAMVGDDKLYPTAAELKERIHLCGYDSYAAMRGDMTSDEALMLLSVDEHDAEKVIDTEPVLPVVDVVVTPGPVKVKK